MSILNPLRTPGPADAGLPMRAYRSVRGTPARWALYGRITALNFKAQASYRGEFLLGLLFGLVWQGALVLFAGVLLLRFPGLGGWTQGDVLLIAAMRLLSHGGYVAFFPNVSNLSFLVQQGNVDGYLLRPLPLYRQVLLARFPINSLGDLLAGVGVFAVALARLDVAWTPVKALYVAAGIIGGMLVEGSLQTALSIAAFRFTGLATWTAWVDETLSTYGNYPLNVLPGAVRGTLTFGLPLAFIAYLPASIVTGHAGTTGVPAWLAAASPAVGLLLFLAVKAGWYGSVRWYQSPGG
ncbi:MAG TPA: ABC-2 family transporter protein [Actinocrinis sp.]|jgi:ABC-2 type transport system permease protein